MAVLMWKGTFATILKSSSGRRTERASAATTSTLFLAAKLRFRRAAQSGSHSTATTLRGGPIGGAVARAFAREGANVFLAGRTLATLDKVAEEISAVGGVAETAQVDALDERAVEEHADAVAKKTGGIDVSFNAVGLPARDRTSPSPA